jgi:AraC-like DNA-binding protein
MIASDVRTSVTIAPLRIEAAAKRSGATRDTVRPMPETLRGVATDRLERSCAERSDWIRLGGGAEGIERAEASFTAQAFSPHRHDTYAIGITTGGVQSFRYRGSRRLCLPGQLHVLHPDETHDGAAATEAGFRYRIAYIEPELIRRALGGGPLPFVADPVHDVGDAALGVIPFLDDIDEPLGELARIDFEVAVADLLEALAAPPTETGPIDARSVELVRERLATEPCEPTSAAALESLTGVDRYTLARQFRRAFGTSPDRYRTLRRLGIVRRAIEQGVPLATAAADAGFADQSHMTRQFKRAFGLTPRRWALTVAAGTHANARG